VTVRPSPLRVSTSVAILAFDWVLLALNLSTHVHEFAYSTLLGACATALTVAFIEQTHDASWQQVSVRATVAGALVAVPLPLLGTVVALTFLVWSGLAHAQAQRAH
jgi:hypothetical protein